MNQHPLIDPEDTDWGQQVERRHAENQRRFSDIEISLGRLWNKIDEADRKRDEAREEIATWFEFLREIKKDLEIAVALFRGARVTAHVIGWMSGLAGAAVAVWQFVWPKK